MAIESFSFDKGINRRKAPLFLEEGELYSCVGFSYDHEGKMECRSAKDQLEAIDTDATSTINGIHRYGSNIYSSSKAYCPGDQALFNYIYHRTTGSYSNIDLLSGKTRPRFADYENFTFLVDGESKRAYIDEHDYEWGVEAPEYAPVLAKGAAGNPNGSYDCYVTFLIGFPNDKWAESAPSPVASITPTNEKIEWTGIITCGYQGEGLIIRRRLWRTVSGTVYLVTELMDNTTTSYSDDVTDATLQASTVLETEEYDIPPIGATDVAIHLQRVFLIKDNSLYWSEAYAPFSFLSTSNVVVTKDSEDLVAVVAWSDQLWLVSAERWLRLQGSDPDTWAVKYTFTDNGVINVHTVKRSIYGIFGLWNDGIYLFDGSVSKNITAKILGTPFFTDLDDLSVCYAEFDGSRYYFYYASSGSTIDSCIIIDCTHFPEFRIYEDNFVADAHEHYKETKHQYWAKSGYEYENGGSEVIETTFVSGDKAFGGILKRKCLEYFYYDIDTNNQDVVVEIYADGNLADSITINTTDRVRKRSRLLKPIEGYRFNLEYSCPDSSSVVIYSPWALEATPVGE